MATQAQLDALERKKEAARAARVKARQEARAAERQSGAAAPSTPAASTPTPVPATQDSPEPNTDATTRLAAARDQVNQNLQDKYTAEYANKTPAELERLMATGQAAQKTAAAAVLNQQKSTSDQYSQLAGGHQLTSPEDEVAAGLQTIQKSGATGPTQFADDEAMTSSPEAQQMQEMIALQKQLAEQQKQSLDQSGTQYQQLRDDYAARESELSGLLEGLGTEERKALEKQRQQLKASQKEDLSRRGLTSTSALDAAMRGVDSSMNESLGQLNERLQKQTMDYRAQFSGETLSAQERATNFQAAAAQTNFAAGQATASGMSQLAEMLAGQRTAGWSNQTDLQTTMLGQSGQRYAADLGYKANLYGLAQRETESQRENELSRYLGDQQTKLGYAGIQAGTLQTGISAAAQKQSAYLGSELARIEDQRRNFRKPVMGYGT